MKASQALTPGLGVRLRCRKRLHVRTVEGDIVVDRRVPKIRDLAPLLKFRKPSLKFKETRLAKAQTIYDLRRIARRRTPKAAFDYTEGAAEAEISLARARQAFEDIEFHPAILKDVSKVTTAWEVLGAPRRVAVRNRPHRVHKDD